MYPFFFFCSLLVWLLIGYGLKRMQHAHTHKKKINLVIINFHIKQITCKSNISPLKKKKKKKDSPFSGTKNKNKNQESFFIPFRYCDGWCHFVMVILLLQQLILSSSILGTLLQHRLDNRLQIRRSRIRL